MSFWTVITRDGILNGGDISRGADQLGAYVAAYYTNSTAELVVIAAANADDARSAFDDA